MPSNYPRISSQFRESLLIQNELIESISSISSTFSIVFNSSLNAQRSFEDYISKSMGDYILDLRAKNDSFISNLCEILKKTILNSKSAPKSKVDILKVLDKRLQGIKSKTIRSLKLSRLTLQQIQKSFELDFKLLRGVLFPKYELLHQEIMKSICEDTRRDITALEYVDKTDMLEHDEHYPHSPFDRSSFEENLDIVQELASESDDKVQMFKAKSFECAFTKRTGIFFVDNE